MLPSPALFVFDLDGTLVDSRRDIAEATNAVLEECGYPPHPDAAIGGMVGEGAAVLIARAFAAARAPAPPDALERFLRVYNRRLLKHTRAYEGIPQLLGSLARHARLGVLTNKPLDATRAILDGLDLARFFGDCVLGGDGPHPRKPDPSGLLQLAAANHAIPARTMMVGDSIIDYRTARAAGSRVCLAAYGFGLPDLQTIGLQPGDLVIDRPSDLLTNL